MSTSRRRKVPKHSREGHEEPGLTTFAKAAVVRRSFTRRRKTRPSTAWSRREWIALAAIVSVAAVLLFWRLGAVYLWQDEANTAVLAVRMLKYGKPLAYDGVNLLTIDNYAAEAPEAIGVRTGDPQKAIEYIMKRGDLKADGSWLFHPWGQFVVAAGSIRALGPTTVAARLPFAIAALATVVLLYVLVRRSTGSATLAAIATTFLALNGSWILHGRQARYYALSSLFVVLTLLTYDRWRRGRRFGAATFVAAAWGMFQVDYGTVWPVLGVLFLHAFVVWRRQIWKPLAAAAILAVTVAPFLIYYQVRGRLSVQLGTWESRFVGTLANMNYFVIPTIALIAAVLLMFRRAPRVPSAERRLVALSLLILLTLLVWVPTAAPEAYVRYVVMAAPAGCIVVAWLVVRGLASWPAIFRWAAATIVLFTPWLSKPLEPLTPRFVPRQGAIVRPEISHLMREVFVPRRDPNRAVVEWLRQHAAPSDEILINYEDAPLMYYLPNPIRGGIAAFRVEDHAKPPPRFAVIRRSVPFVHWPVFIREVSRHEWATVPVGAPDVTWGNNPDPLGRVKDPRTAPELVIGRWLRTKTP